MRSPSMQIDAVLIDRQSIELLDENCSAANCTVTCKRAVAHMKFETGAQHDPFGGDTGPAHRDNPFAYAKLPRKHQAIGRSLS